MIFHTLLEVNGTIPEKNFASSSVHSNNPYWKASEGRLNKTHIKYGTGAGVWCAAKNDKTPWLSVKLLESAKVTRVVTQGSPLIYAQRTKSYNLSYSMDGKKWIVYRENGKEHVSSLCCTRPIYVRDLVIHHCMKGNDKFLSFIVN